MARRFRIDLNEIKNDKCHKKCSKEERQAITDDNVCKLLVSAYDGLPVRCVGDWSYEKIHYLIQYFGIFAQGMKRQWSGLNYIEICCGLGRCILREMGLEIDGTSLAIIKHKNFDFIKNALFIDIDKTVIDTLNMRIHNVLGLNSNAMAIIGDYDDPQGTAKIISTLNKDYLNLVFIDPTHCDVPFETVKKVAGMLNNVDFIFNVAVGTDANRNLINATLDKRFNKAKRKYLKFLGVDDFFEREDVINEARRENNKNLLKLFIETFMASLKKIGYLYVDIKPVRHYYYLVFASRNKRGLEFWKKACAIDPSNQRELPL